MYLSAGVQPKQLGQMVVDSAVSILWIYIDHIFGIKILRNSYYKNLKKKNLQ
jgi:hypothetical protein